RYARAFGFGASTGIELQGEKFGLVPRPTRRTWPLGETVNLSIGQGAGLVTPTQVARFMAAVANGGVLWRPRIVQRIERPEGGVLYSDAGQVNGHVELSPVVWEFLRRSLWAAVNDGTGAAARIPGLDIAGKTGTAQLVGKSKAALGQDTAWFAPGLGPRCARPCGSASACSRSSRSRASTTGGSSGPRPPCTSWGSSG